MWSIYAGILFIIMAQAAFIFIPWMNYAFNSLTAQSGRYRTDNIDRIFDLPDCRIGEMDKKSILTPTHLSRGINFKDTRDPRAQLNFMS